MKQLLIIGYGNMAGAMLAGWMAAGFDPGRFAVLNRSEKAVPDGVAFSTHPRSFEDADDHDAIMLGFKPHQLGDLAPGFQALAKGRPVFSLLAGITVAQLQGAFPHASAHVRVMPNLASRINKSPIILSAKGASASERSGISDMFGPLGEAVWLEDEGQFDLATALAGSGPGFVYRFIDALSEAGAALGLEPEQSKALALAMMDGATSLAAKSEFAPAELADRVASPGGMTREGLNVLDQDGALVDLLTRTLKATRDRGAELSSGAK